MRVNRHETRDGMTTFSLCMIVKDEEEVLSRCLNSLCDIMDEIIIVDTGSTDRTKEIAKKYTDKVFDYKWCNDFENFLCLNANFGIISISHKFSHS